MTNARAGSINLIADARGDGTAALVPSIYAVVDFLPDNRHMVSAGALAAVADFAHVVTIQASSLRAVADVTVPTAAQAASIYLLADLNPDRVNIASIYAVCEAERPKFAQATGVSAVVNARSQTPPALVSELFAIANARSVKPPALVSTVNAVALFQVPIEIQATSIYAVAAMTYTPQVQTANLLAVANAFAQHQARVCSLFAIVDGVLAGEPHEYLPNRMRHGKRSKLGAISPYNQAS